MDLTKYSKKGYTGIDNLGNTCFLNSCLQVLNHTYELNEVLDKIGETIVDRQLADTSVLNEWNDLRKTMWSGNGVVSPNKFVHNIHTTAKIKGKEIFTGYAQNDMPEFLLFIIDCIHNSISRSVTISINGNTQNGLDELAIKCYSMLKTVYTKEYSEIMDLFFGIYMSIITNKDGTHNISIKPEHYFILDLPIADNTNTIYECFDLFMKSELLEGDNGLIDEKTGVKQDVNKQIYFWNFPKILTVCLKRFSATGTHKLNNLIEFPLNDLDLSKYIKGYHPASYKYELYGVCNHIGGVMGGHYTAFIKHADNTWIHFNDSSVEIVDEPQKIITPLAYCLFYRKKII
jgi:ubiquitin C-terminal hydrolase